MARRLTKIKLNEVSLVDRPASPGARVLLYKRDGGADQFSHCKDCPDKGACTKAETCALDTADEAKKSVAAIIKLTATPQEKRSLIDTVLRKLTSEGYEAVADTILKSLPSDITENTMPDPNLVREAVIGRLEVGVTKADMDKAIAEAVAKATTEAAASRDAEIKKAVEAAEKKADERVKKAEDSVEKMAEAAAKSVRISKAEAMIKDLTGVTATEFEPVLKGMSEDSVKVLEKVLEAARTISKEARKMVIKENGNAAVNKGNSYQEAVTKATELRKSDHKLTQEQAVAKVWMDNPDLYAQYLNESGQGGKH